MQFWDINRNYPPIKNHRKQPIFCSFAGDVEVGDLVQMLNNKYGLLIETFVDDDTTIEWGTIMIPGNITIASYPTRTLRKLK